MTNINI